MDVSENDFDRWQKLKDIFTEAIELAPESRHVYLSQLRINDKTLSDELAELIASEEESEEFLKKPFEINFDLPSVQNYIGARIGNYKITREIGRGGMGAVFEATRQDDEFEQKVAVKLTDNSFLSDEFRRRFNNERQILAALEHPNIVRLFDGGILPNQTPYFVMEYVEGVSLKNYCRENAIDLEEKLDLFLQVCAAVTYAHQKLIVHRDLKPSNILVTENGQVKLLDFGIAKTLDKAAQTQTANAPHTPAYASPEQIKGESSSTLSDVYSLGIILYELLTEKSPAQIYQTSEFGLPQAICETNPKSPSAEMQKEKTKSKNPKPLKGDLDNIVLKALRKEKEQRYASVERFADDIGNYLNGLPVQAHPQSFVYRASKFIKRNRLTVSLAAMAILLIISGVVAALWQSFEARKQQQIAEQRFAQVRKIANSLIFDYHDEIAKLEGSTKLREKLVVDAVGYLDAIAQSSKNDTELMKETALAYRKIGDVQGAPYVGNLGKHDEALKNYKNSVSLLEKAVAQDQSDDALKDELIGSYKSLAIGEMRSEHQSQAEEILNKAINLSENLIRSDENNLDRKLVRSLLQVSLGDGEMDLNKSLLIYKKSLHDTKKLFLPYPSDFRITNLLAKLNQRISTRLRWIGEQGKAGGKQATEEVYRQSVEHAYQAIRYQELTVNLSGKKNDWKTAVCYAELASDLINVGQMDEALKNTRIAEKLYQGIRTQDPNNKEIVLEELNIYNLKQKISIRQGKFDSALETIKTALKIAENSHQNDSTNSEVIGWVGHFAKEAVNLLQQQKKEREARVYLDLFDNYARKYKETFGKEWTGAFGF